jgi:hypothetical protein
VVPRPSQNDREGRGTPSFQKTKASGILKASSLNSYFKTASTSGRMAFSSLRCTAWRCACRKRFCCWLLSAADSQTMQVNCQSGNHQV